MALYHLSVKIITRKSGSACAAAAYRSGQKIASQYDGTTYDYRNKKYVEDSVIVLPENAPARFADPEVLWNSVEQTEKQVNAQLAREVEFSLPIELSIDERKKLALDYVQEQFVSKGMCAHICFHDPHSKKRNPERISNNPHCHVLLTMRPLDATGNWEPKNVTLYCCEKNGNQEMKSSQDIKDDPEWEKLYNYVEPSGKTGWYTKSFVESQEDEYKLLTRFPKRQNVQNSVCAEWNSVESLKEWRRAWAEKANIYLENNMIAERIDHRSYKDQGKELLPTVHEGKAITAIERKYEQEYEERIMRGENAVLKHTEVRKLNIAIKAHNREIKLMNEMQKLIVEMEQIVKPVRERIQTAYRTVAEKLEILRAKIIGLSVRIRRAVDLKSKAEERISIGKAYLKDIERNGSDVCEMERKLFELHRKAHRLGKRSTNTEVEAKIQYLENAIIIQKENIENAAFTEKEIVRLSEVSVKTGDQIIQMKDERDRYNKEYTDIEKSVPAEQLPDIRQERILIRDRVEKEFLSAEHLDHINNEKNIFDKKYVCTIENLINCESAEEVKGISYTTF